MLASGWSGHGAAGLRMTVARRTVLNVPEPIASWWARRQVSRRSDVPYVVGTYRESWAFYPVLVHQYHPEFNRGIVLSQIPPAADVYLCWQCDVGHVFVATPAEQRSRPGRERRRSSWCPECAELAQPRTPVMPLRERVSDPPVPPRSPETSPPRRRPASRRPKALCPLTPELPVGEAFASACAPDPASAVEAQLRADLAGALEFTPGLTAIRLGRPFFDHVEAWPDILLSDLRVALEYDSTGRHGLEHVGQREEADRRKDRAVRAAGWEVIRLRTGKLQALGPHDLLVSGLTKKTVALVLDELRVIRGPLLVDAYQIRRAAPGPR